MDNKIELVTSGNIQGDRKPYHSPSKMTVLGGIEAVVRASVTTSASDGHGPNTGS